MTGYLFWLSVLQIIWIDILLSGDNAVVIAMACKSLAPKQRMIGITLGVILALVLRILLAGVISYLIAIPLLKIIGGLLLIYIATKLVIGEDDGDSKHRHSEKLLMAVGFIVMADLTMSLDNVVAIAAAAHGNDLLFVLGLLVSMPLMIVGASLITALIGRFPAIVWAGGALLGWIAGGMIASDPYALWLLPDPMEAAGHYVGSAVAMVAVIGTGWALRPRAARELRGEG